MAHILIVEDEYPINELIKRNLHLTGHTCNQAYDGKAAKELYNSNNYDLILLDIMLPEISGFELLPLFSDTPVIFITAKDQISDKLRGLTSGAEDYIVKPFDILEMLARVQIVLRRNRQIQNVFTLGEVTIDFGEHTVHRGGTLLEITPQEFTLLETLVANRNLAVSREKLLELAWGYTYEGTTRTIDTHIQKLRKKLGWEEHIKTIYKMGYRLEAPC